MDISIFRATPEVNKIKLSADMDLLSIAAVDRKAHGYLAAANHASNCCGTGRRVSNLRFLHSFTTVQTRCLLPVTSYLIELTSFSYEQVSCATDFQHQQHSFRYQYLIDQRYKLPRPSDYSRQIYQPNQFEAEHQRCPHDASVSHASFRL